MRTARARVSSQEEGLRHGIAPTKNRDGDALSRAPGTQRFRAPAHGGAHRRPCPSLFIRSAISSRTPDSKSATLRHPQTGGSPAFATHGRKHSGRESRRLPHATASPEGISPVRHDIGFIPGEPNSVLHAFHGCAPHPDFHQSTSHSRTRLATTLAPSPRVAVWREAAHVKVCAPGGGRVAAQSRLNRLASKADPVRLCSQNPYTGDSICSRVRVSRHRPPLHAAAHTCSARPGAAASSAGQPCRRTPAAPPSATAATPPASGRDHSVWRGRLMTTRPEPQPHRQSLSPNDAAYDQQGPRRGPGYRRWPRPPLRRLAIRTPRGGPGAR